MDMDNWILANGYRFAGLHCGIRPDPDRLDLALVVSDRPARAAGVFTQNLVCAAPVQVCRERLPGNHVRGLVICSGNANACTGQRGLEDARRMTSCLAASLGCPADQVLVCSTGVIGRLLPMPAIEAGIAQAATQLASDAAAFGRAAHAILTTDTHIKVSTRKVACAGGDVHLTGFAKGAAMIGPNMATMLAFVLTDAALTAHDLATLARTAAQRSFNCISVEGHTSTNDSLIFLANGQGSPLQGEALEQFRQAATAVCTELAQAIAGDAEGATHLITIDVAGLGSDEEARRVAKTVAESALVKTAFFGADPNWGRLVSAAGYAGVDFDPTQLSLWLGEIMLYQQGMPVPFDEAAASDYIKNNRQLAVRLICGSGPGRCRFWTCDLTYEYVRLNAEYTT